MSQKGGVNVANRFHKARIYAVCEGSILLIYLIYLIARPPRLTRAARSAYNREKPTLKNTHLIGNKNNDSSTGAERIIDHGERRTNES